MVELIPYPFGKLVSRMFRELRDEQAIFDLPSAKFVLGDGVHDCTVSFHGVAAATPFGPAAGPQSQMAQNLVLAWLGGSRILELKTVQIQDELDIPRPCIDMHNVGYNVEWSQELKLEQSLEEYVKGSMLIDMLVASGELGLAPGFDATIYDMSVGYDLAGIRTERVQAFVRGMRDARGIVDRLRGEIPGELAVFRDLDFCTSLSNTLTLSTFHGCPPDEIERIIEFLLEEVGLSCVVKLNPTLLGPSEVGRLVRDELGYGDLCTPAAAFEKDTTWEQAIGFTERLKARADNLGLGFGVKFNNTLIVENHRDFFPQSEKEMYLSGPPLHVLAVQLVDRFRAHFGDRIPISFSAGVDRVNFPDAVAIGLVPVTVCSDLLKPGGYGRQSSYFSELHKRMDAVGARDVGDFVLKAYGNAEAALADIGVDRPELRRAAAAGGDLRAAAGPGLHARWVSAALLRNTRLYAERVVADPRYAAAANSRVPKKIGSHLTLFDCITCDKCIPVCPNDANFALPLPETEIPVVVLTSDGDSWRARRGEPLRWTKKHQIANFADFCNECGNCDVFCPEDGGPYVVKPRFFGSRASWREFRGHDGFYVERAGGRETVLARFSGREFKLVVEGEGARFASNGFDIACALGDPEGTAEGEASTDVDLTYFHIMDEIRKAVLAGGRVTYVG